MTFKHFHQTATHLIDQLLYFLAFDFFLKKKFKNDFSELIYYVPTI